LADRDARISRFLEQAGWSDAIRSPLAGDASNRRYERLNRADGGTAVLMDAPAERGEDVRPFLRVARILQRWSLAPPGILAEDTGAGLLLIEDLGDDLFARVLERSPEAEEELYGAALDVLVELARHDVPAGEAAYGTKLMSERAALAYEWYLHGAAGMPDPALIAEFRACVESALAALPQARPTFALRDFHAENLIWRPDRAGLSRVGLIDFQDALAAYPGYDLASLVTDARRNVPPALRAALTERFACETSRSVEQIGEAVAVLSAQRNLRILGVFARLAMLFGKPGYLKLIPRVWGYLKTDLDHPALNALSKRVRADLPAPDEAILARIGEVSK
jgi:aminoglycoside/choline kinase family phosphotransferase